MRSVSVQGKAITVALVIALAATRVASPEHAAAAAPIYEMVGIGSLVETAAGQFDGLTNVFPRGLNGSGVVIADARPSNGSFWSVAINSADGNVTPLGNLDEYSLAGGINDAGDMVGLVMNKEDISFATPSAVVWRDGTATKLPTLGGERSSAWGINGAGHVAGDSAITAGQNAANHAVLWEFGMPRDLGTLGGRSSHAAAVSDDGVVVGWSQAADRPGSHPVIWQSGMITELPAPNGLQGAANAVNLSGVVVGFALDFTDSVYTFHPIVWEQMKPHSLPTLVEDGWGNASGINDAGDIVGYSTFVHKELTETHAVIWHGDDVFDLNAHLAQPTKLVLTSAVDINNSGQIIAMASTLDGSGQHGVILTPAKSSSHRPLAAWPNAPVAALRN